MKRYTNSLVSLLILLAILISTVVPVGAASGTQPSKYSSTLNSGTRNVVCTTLDGTTAAGYYTGSYTYEKLSTQSASTILNSLRTLMKTGHKSTSYNDCKNYADKMDCQNESGKMTSIYTSFVTNYSSGGINREHVWPKSLGGFETSGAGADLHHIRPSEETPNSNRGNLKYGNVTGGKTSIGNKSGKEAGTYGTYFEPLDNVKGDVARICLYVYARYGGELSKCSSITNVFQSVDVLLEWCELDPVDTWEMGRNEVVYKIQGNRNVFIDYPEYAWLVFGRSVPANYQTPTSSGTQGGGSSGSTCTHATTETRNAVAATCTSTGYTGDKYCTSCGVLVASGTTIAKTSHTTVSGVGKTDATCGNPGYTGDTKCTVCQTVTVQGSVIPATGDHSWGEVTITNPPTTESTGTGQKTCTVCGATRRVTIPMLENEGDTPDIPGGDTPDVPGGDTPDVPGGDTPDVPGGDTPDVPGGDTPDTEVTEVTLALILAGMTEAERVIVMINLGVFASAYYDLLAEAFSK